MKVGDLVKVKLIHRLGGLVGGELGVIIEENDWAPDPKWKVVIMTGEGYWLKPNELELVE
jgi:hypothetical protein